MPTAPTIVKRATKGSALTTTEIDANFQNISDVVAGIRESLVVAAGDETTAIKVATGLVTFRLPYAFTLTAVRGSLTTAQGAGSLLTFDVKAGGTSVFTTKPSFNNASKSTVGGTASALTASPLSMSDDTEITVDVTQIGDGTGKGLKVVLIGYRP